MENLIERLYLEFIWNYSYVVVDREVVRKFYEEFKSTDIHLLYDYILANDLAEGVVE